VTVVGSGAVGVVVLGCLWYGALSLFAGVLVTGVATAAEFARRSTRRGLRDEDGLAL
jgi:hypothetical protein